MPRGWHVRALLAEKVMCPVKDLHILVYTMCYEWTACIVRQLFPGKLPLELRVDSIHGGASFWNRV